MVLASSDTAGSCLPALVGRDPALFGREPLSADDELVRLAVKTLERLGLGLPSDSSEHGVSERGGRRAKASRSTNRNTHTEVRGEKIKRKLHSR